VATRDVRWAYEVLGLPLGSAPDDVRQAYRDLITVWHPDRFQNNPRLRDQSNKKAQEINAAFALLRDLKSSGPSATKKAQPPPPPPRAAADDTYRRTAHATGERYGRNWDDLNSGWQAAIRRGVCPRCGPSGKLERLDREHRCAKCDARFPLMETVKKKNRTPFDS
jgi:DnaJ-class molecular chaperone